MDFIQQVLRIAAGELGVHEQGEANWGPRVREYINSIGWDQPVYWCAAYVRWVLTQAAKGSRFPLVPDARGSCRTEKVPILWELAPHEFGYCPNLGAYGRREGILYERPQPGDIFLIPHPKTGRFFHTGLVEAVSSTGSFLTLEGNTNDDGSNNGYKVARRSRHVGRPRFVRWGEQMNLAVGGDAATRLQPQAYHLFLNAEDLGEMPLINGTSYFAVRDWAKVLGLPFTYDEEEQTVWIGASTLDTDLTMNNGRLVAPIRDLVREAGLTLIVDNSTRKVQVTRG